MPNNAAGASAFSHHEDGTRSLADTAPATRVVHTTCSLDCPDSCGVLATIDLASHRVIRIAGDPAHLVTRGFLCGKVTRYLDRVYAPDRLLHPSRGHLRLRRSRSRGLSEAGAPSVDR